MDRARAKKLIESGKRWGSLGVSVVPVQTRTKACLIHWREFEGRITTGEELINWFTPGLANIAVVTGGTSGLVVLDFDNDNMAGKWIYQAGAIGKTYTEFSSKGIHLFYLADNHSMLASIGKRSEPEVFSGGHLCLVYPSIHPDGTEYSLANNALPLLEVESKDLFYLLSKGEARQRPCQAARAQDILSSPCLYSGKDLLTQIKAEYQLFTEISKTVELRPSGADGWYIGLCPFHKDELPSLWVNAFKQVWGCYSPVCKANQAGDVINWLALKNGQPIKEIIRELARGLMDA